jgi:hypothetical protein
LDKICQVQKINYILADAKIRQNTLNWSYHIDPPAMCGILLTLRSVNTEEHVDVLKFRNEVAKRGPDSLKTHYVQVQPPHSGIGFELEFTSSVLALRGEVTVEQPLSDEDSVFCWNGQVFRGLNVEVGQNDTLKIWEAVKAGHSLAEVLSQVEGP